MYDKYCETYFQEEPSDVQGVEEPSTSADFVDDNSEPEAPSINAEEYPQIFRNSVSMGDPRKASGFGIGVFCCKKTKSSGSATFQSNKREAEPSKQTSHLRSVFSTLILMPLSYLAWTIYTIFVSLITLVWSKLTGKGSYGGEERASDGLKGDYY